MQPFDKIFARFSQVPEWKAISISLEKEFYIILNVWKALRKRYQSEVEMLKNY